MLWSGTLSLVLYVWLTSCVLLVNWTAARNHHSIATNGQGLGVGLQIGLELGYGFVLVTNNISSNPHFAHTQSQFQLSF